MSAPVADGYVAALAAAKAAIQAARTRAVLAVNSELIGLYWDLGQMILDRQQAEGWGAKSSTDCRPIYAPSSWA
jgi:DUF1016 N-terminal domain